MNLIEQIGSHEPQELVIAGNFNLVLDNTLDSSNVERNNNDKAKAVLQCFLEEVSCVDIWRIQNKLNPKYTASRIDYFFVNFGLNYFCKSDILPTICTDHSIITLQIDFDKIQCGKGYWKFNNSHIKDPEFLDCMNKNIKDIIAYFYKESDDIKMERN